MLVGRELDEIKWEDPLCIRLESGGSSDKLRIFLVNLRGSAVEARCVMFLWTLRILGRGSPGTFQLQHPCAGYVLLKRLMDSI